MAKKKTRAQLEATIKRLKKKNSEALYEYNHECNRHERTISLLQQERSENTKLRNKIEVLENYRSDTATKLACFDQMETRLKIIINDKREIEDLYNHLKMLYDSGVKHDVLKKA